MLVKINRIRTNKVNVTELDIDEYGAIIPVRKLVLTLPTSDTDNSLYKILKSTPYAAVFIRQEFTQQNNITDSTIILANPITVEELNLEKNRVIESYTKKDNIIS